MQGREGVSTLMDLNNETILRALRIVSVLGGTCSPRDFACHMWPQSPGWRKPARRVRRGVTHGTVMNTAGGAFLGRLRGRGLVDRGTDHELYVLTPAGEGFLARQGRPPEPSP